MSRSVGAAPAPQRHSRVRRSQSAASARRRSAAADQPRRVDPRPPTRPRALPSPRPLRAVSGGGAALAGRVTDLAVNLSGSRAMDRLMRSRGWIFIVGFSLIGIVAMQVSLLKLNAGIGRAVNSSATLERGNAQLRMDVSRLSATDRIQRLAAERGFAMPAPADVGYLQAGDPLRDGRRAAQSMRPPDPRGAGAVPTSAQPAPPQADSAVVTSGPGSAGAAQSPPAAGGTAPSGTAAGGLAPSGTAAGGIAPPTQSAAAAP